MDSFAFEERLRFRTVSGESFALPLLLLREDI